jgi:ADP-heptose:LPS heptosyltransferase
MKESKIKITAEANPGVVLPKIKTVNNQNTQKIIPWNSSRPRPVNVLKSEIRKIIFSNWLSPGDVVMMTAAIRDLHLSYPGKFITDVRTPCNGIWENNPYITRLNEADPSVEKILLEYPLIHECWRPYHFIHGFRKFMESKIGMPIQAGPFQGDLHISPMEKSWISQVEETEGLGTRFWIIVSGGKTDFTAKWWDPKRTQEVVDHFQGKIKFVQVGEAASSHIHPPLEGVIDLVGKTNLRQMVRLMYHADGVVCPVTFLMHLAAAVETKSGRPKNRPCVVIAGGREHSHWEAYPYHQYLHTMGMLPCCHEGGCWKSRVVPLGDGDDKDKSLCIYPVESSTGSGFTIPKCLDMISSQDVIRAIEGYLTFDTMQKAEPESVYSEITEFHT